MNPSFISTLQDAKELYEDFFGCKPIDLEWTIDEKYSIVTKPSNKKDFFVDDKVLVGSGEQTFIKYMVEGKLEKNTIYYGITPCFRDDALDKIHHRYFMKMELFCWCDDEILYDHLCDMAKCFFVECELSPVKVSKDTYAVDLEHKGIELGSYLFHTAIIDGKEYKWSCGTAVALPRLYEAKSL